MRVGIGDYGLPACESTAQASWTGCVVVPGVTKGTLTMADQGISNVVFGQVVDLTPQAIDAFHANTQAAADAGHAVIATADPGAVPGAVPVDTAAAMADTQPSGIFDTDIAIGLVLGILILRSL